MRRSQIVVLWIGGMWTVLLIIIVGVLVTPGGGMTPLSFLAVVLIVSLPVWIMCGLIWVTLNRKSRGPNRLKGLTPSDT